MLLYDVPDSAVWHDHVRPTMEECLAWGMCLFGVLLFRLGDGRINGAWPAAGGFGTGLVGVDVIMDVRSEMIIQYHLAVLR